AKLLTSKLKLIILDEPTTALDVTIQAQILDLIKHLSETRTMSVILITHDLGVVAGMCDTVAVMYAGKIVEQAPVDTLFRNPAHPYTRGLLHSVPRIDRAWSERLYSIPGSPPDLVNIPEGCAFAPRCESAMPICRRRYPLEFCLDDAGRVAQEYQPHMVRCWLHASSMERNHAE
ncbi:MAG: peptide ABC transporter ATP-binding protein, partial [Spirochaetales bacterium]|nr:peptide ABC transporter ATP-binding protein [Spirochaetales bacterium]